MLTIDGFSAIADAFARLESGEIFGKVAIDFLHSQGNLGLELYNAAGARVADELGVILASERGISGSAQTPAGARGQA